MLILLCVLVIPFVGQSPDSLRLPEAMAFARAHRGSLVAATAAVDEARGGLSERRQLPNPTASYTHTTDLPRQSATVRSSSPYAWTIAGSGQPYANNVTTITTNVTSLRKPAYIVPALALNVLPHRLHW